MSQLGKLVTTVNSSNTSIFDNLLVSMYIWIDRFKLSIATRRGTITIVDIIVGSHTIIPV